MQPVIGSIQNQGVPKVQNRKDLSEHRQGPAKGTASNTDGEPANLSEDKVTLSTRQSPRVDFKPAVPSVPVSQAERKALSKSFSIRV